MGKNRKTKGKDAKEEAKPPAKWHGPVAGLGVLAIIYLILFCLETLKTAAK